MTMKTSSLKFHRLSGQQSGVALVVALVFLLALTVIGIATMSTNSVEARMAYSFSDYSRAFQAAESGVAEGERWLDAQTVKPVAASGCDVPNACRATDLVWASQIKPAATDWFRADWWTQSARPFGYDYPQGGGTPVAFPDHVLTRTAAPPRYVIEEIGRDNSSSIVSGVGPSYGRYYYRITSMGMGAQSTTTTVVQSVYLRPY